jgi:hypothetical protein
MYKSIVVVFLFLLSFSIVHAQLGGNTNFSFVESPISARIGAVGGVNVSLRDKDVSMASSNPALACDTIHLQSSFSFQPFYADIKKSSLMGAYALKKDATVFGGIHYIDYGSIDKYDPSGNSLGTFNPNDYTVMLGVAQRKGVFSLGITSKYAHSQIDSYKASALLFDFGGVFTHPKRNWNIGLTMKNIGFVLSKYTTSTDFTTPFDIQLGTSYKFDHVPLRISLTAHHLHQWDIVYNDPAINYTLNLDGTKTIKETKFSDKLLRHFVIGAEFLLTKNFHFRSGYNFLLRREMKLVSNSKMTGFSWGFMLRTRKFEVAFTRMYYHPLGGTNTFTLVLNINEWKRK